MAGDVHGAFRGVKVIELTGLGPVPFAGMVLAEMVAEVLRIALPGNPRVDIPVEADLFRRGRSTIVLDLKELGHVEVLTSIADRSDVLHAATDGIRQARAAPRLSGTLSKPPEVPWPPLADPLEVLARWGIEASLIDRVSPAR